MSQLIYFTGPYVGLVLMFFFLRQIFPAKVSFGRMLLMFTPMLLGHLPKALLGSASPVAQASGIVFTLLCCTIYPVLVLEGRKWKTICVALFFYALQMLADSICYGVFGSRLGMTSQDYTAVQIAAYDGATWLIYVLVCSVCLLLLRAVAMRRFRPFYLLFLVFPLSQSWLVFCCVYRLQNLFWVFSLLLGLTAELGLLSYAVSQEKRRTLEREVSGARQVLELEHAHYRAVEERQEELARIRHDFRNQLSAIGRLIRQGEEDDAQRLIGRLSEEIGKTRANPYCGIPVVNAILTEKARACGEAGLGLTVELDIPRELAVEPMHLCSIFSNLMDNAIRGAAESGEAEPAIRLRSMMEGDYLFIKTVNPAGPPRKKPGKGHGYGQRILRDIASRYGGELRTGFRDGVYTAVVTLMIHNEEEGQ